MKAPGPNVFRSQVREYVVERRNPETGILTVLGDQPPLITGTADDIIRHYFRLSRDTRPSGSQEEIGQWYAAREWFWRPKTW